MDHTEVAAIEASRAKVKRAAGLLHDAIRGMASAHDRDSVGAFVAHDADTINSAVELIALGVAKYGRVQVVVLPDGPPPRPDTRAKESHNGRDDREREAPPREPERSVQELRR